MNDINKYLVWLSTIPQFGSTKINKLLNHFKNPIEIYEASLNGIKSLSFLNPNDIDKLNAKKYKDDLSKYLDALYRHDIKCLSIYDKDYPNNLKNIYSPPPLLYYKGTSIADEKYIAIVGSRKSTSYGNNMAYIISKELSKLGYVIVSGMARGIDSKAHLASIDSDSRTLAVVGCGLDTVYPKENKKLMDSIISKGLVYSEYPPFTKPLAINFPARNRIISGLSLGVIVVEASEKSGSLITANFALEQGREVFALPGNLISKNSIGSNKLIKDGAKMVTSIDDILEEIKYLGHPEKLSTLLSSYENQINSLKKGLSQEELKVLESIKGEELHIDKIANITNLEIKTLSSILIVLELKGIVEQSPGKFYKIKIV